MCEKDTPLGASDRMSYEIDYRVRLVCDKCGRKATFWGKEEEPNIPNWLGEIALAIWEDGHRETTSGNEDRFSQVCPKCIKDLSFLIHDYNKEKV